MDGFFEFDDVMREGLFEDIEDIMAGDLRMVDSCAGGGQPLAVLPTPAAFPSSWDVDGSGLSATSEDHNKICDGLNINDETWFSMLDSIVNDFNLPSPATVLIPDADNGYITKDESDFRSPSPVSVLEQSNLTGDGGEGGGRSFSDSSSSKSANNEVDVLLCVASPLGPVIRSPPARARTKRPRPAAFVPRVLATVLPPELDANATKKRKKISRTPLAAARTDDPAVARKCVHCGIQKTPQWRAGPNGPKTLCNACGVRYKSGRLFPEYRPAASPTFVPSIHSNSHKRVVEMRIKATENDTNATTPKISPAAKNCDLLRYIRRTV